MNTTPTNTTPRPIPWIIDEVRDLNQKMLRLRTELSQVILTAHPDDIAQLRYESIATGPRAKNDAVDAATIATAMLEPQKKQAEESVVTMEQQLREHGQSPGGVAEQKLIGTRICEFCGQGRPSGPGPCPVCDDVVVGLKKKVEVELAIKEERFAKKEMDAPAKQVEKSDHCSLLPTIILFGGNREHELAMMKEEMPDANWKLLSSRDGKMLSEMSYDYVVVNAMIVPPGAMDYAKKRIPTGRSVCWNGTKRDMERCCAWLREKIKVNTKPVKE